MYNIHYTIFPQLVIPPVVGNKLFHDIDITVSTKLNILTFKINYMCQHELVSFGYAQWIEPNRSSKCLFQFHFHQNKIPFLHSLPNIWSSRLFWSFIKQKCRKLSWMYLFLGRLYFLQWTHNKEFDFIILFCAFKRQKGANSLTLCFWY